MEDDDDNGVCDDQEVYGCSYPLAENFSSSVTRDDGSCIFPCEGVVNTNVFDWDSDYVVTVTDSNDAVGLWRHGCGFGWGLGQWR